MRRWIAVCISLVLAGCTAADPASPLGMPQAGRLSGELTMGTEVWPTGAPGYLTAFGQSYHFKSSAAGVVEVFGNWTPQSSAATTLSWTIFNESSGGKIVIQQDATGGFRATFDALGIGRYRIDVHPTEGNLVAQQQVHIDIVGTAGLEAVNGTRDNQPAAAIAPHALRR